MIITKRSEVENVAYDIKRNPEIYKCHLWSQRWVKYVALMGERKKKDICASMSDS
jgi:hypothetical protein